MAAAGGHASTSTSSSSEGGQPLELVRFDQASGRFAVGLQALRVLRATTGPISVVAVCGRARQGKSFILNNLLQVTGGFQIGSTTRPCTKGLWMWSAPQRRVDAEGKPYHLVLLDSEGIDAYDQTATYSTQIFSLAVLLSSTFVFNQMGGIDEAALDRLSLVTEMSRHIRVRANSPTGDARELAAFTPSFLWLLRDFYLKLEDEQGRQFSASDYLETALLPVAGSGPAVAAKNAIRASIKALFPDRCCATLVRPMHDEQALVSLDSLPPQQLRAEFRQGVAALLELILAKSQPRPFGSLGVMTGPLLAGLAEAYVAAINAGAVPTIATAWQGVAEAECRRAAEAGEAAYAAAFSEAVPGDEAALDAEHARCLALAAAAFDDAAVGDAGIRAAHQQKLRDACGARYAQLRARKLAEAAAQVAELLLAGNQVVNAALAAPDATPELLQQLLGQFVARYTAATSGALKWPRLVEFLQTAHARIVTELVQRSQSQAKADVGRMLAELSAAHKSVKAAGARADKAEADAAASAAAVAQLQQQLASQAAELACVRVDAESRAGQAAAVSAQLRELQLAAEQRLTAASAEGQAALRSERLELQADINRLAAALSEEQQRRRELDTEVAELEARLAAASGQLSGALQASSEHLERHRRAKADAASLAKQLQELQLAHASFEVQHRLAAAERDAAVGAVQQLEQQLEQIGADIACHMQEAEQERARICEAAASTQHLDGVVPSLAAPAAATAAKGNQQPHHAAAAAPSLSGAPSPPGALPGSSSHPGLPPQQWLKAAGQPRDHS